MTSRNDSQARSQMRGLPGIANAIANGIAPAVAKTESRNNSSISSRELGHFAIPTHSRARPAVPAFASVASWAAVRGEDIYGRCPRCGARFDEWWQNDCRTCGWSAES